VYELAEFHDCLQRVAMILRRCEVRFFLTGGAAAIAYGDPRTTQDVDLVVDAVPLKAALPLFFEEARSNRFLFSEQAVRDALALDRQFQLIDLDSTLKSDLYPRELVPGALDRAAEIEVAPGMRVPVASRPDLVVSKLIWISLGSHKSRRDVKQIMQRMTDAEKPLLYELAGQVNLRTLLDEVLAEPDEIDA
jgi:hypothetical protein